MSEERRRAYVRLALVLRQIHHQRFLSLRLVVPPWWKVWDSMHLVDDAGNRYDEPPWLT